MSDTLSSALAKDARASYAAARTLPADMIDASTVRRLMEIAADVPSTCDRNGRTLAQRVRRLRILREHAAR